MQKEYEKVIKRLQNEVKEEKDEDLRFEQQQRLIVLANKYNGEDRIITQEELVEAHKNRPVRNSVSTGHTNLDKAIGGGFMERQVVVVTGSSKHGKTSWCMDITNNIPEANPVWIPIEEDIHDLFDQYDKVKEEYPKLYTPAMVKERSIDWIEARLIESVVKYGSKVAFIDHLHYIIDDESGREREDQTISRIMHRLKDLANMLDIAIVLIAHINKDKAEEVPRFSELKGSSAIYQVADTVIVIWRKNKKGEHGSIEFSNEIIASIQLNRYAGGSFAVSMRLESNSRKFIEDEWALDEAKEKKEEQEIIDNF